LPQVLGGRSTLRLAHRRLGVQRGRADPVALHLVGQHLVVPLHRHIHPRLRRMEVHVARTETRPVADRSFIRELAVGEAEQLERARIFRCRRGGITTSGADHDEVPGGRDADLVGVDTDIDRFALHDHVADRAVRVQRVHGQVRRLVVGDQEMTSGRVHADVDRPIVERHGLVELAQASGSPIDPIGGNAMGVVRLRPIAVGHVHHRHHRVHPDVLHGLGHARHAVPGKSQSRSVHCVQTEICTDRGVEQGASRWGGRRLGRRARNS
jgi:hypothetical protein